MKLSKRRFGIKDLTNEEKESFEEYEKLLKHNIEKIDKTNHILRIATSFALTIFVTLGTFEVYNLSKVNEDQKSKLSNQDKIIQLEQTFIEQGVESAKSGKLTDAISSYQKALNLDENNFVALNFLGYAQLRKGETDLALKNLSKSAQIAPDYCWAHYNFALALWIGGNKDGALEEVKKTISCSEEMKKYLIHDNQFDKFRKDPRFESILNEK